MWAEISLQAILHNLRVIRKQVGASTKNSGGGEVERLRTGRRAGGEGAAEGRDGMVRRNLRERRRGTARGGHPQTDSDFDGFWPGEEKRLIQNNLTPTVTRVD